jgi:serine/threonine protein kinase
VNAPASFQAPGSLRPGAVLAGRYVIEATLGAGGFGQVYRARQEPLGRLVAVKVLLAKTASLSPGQSERFKREAHLAMRLEHPNTVRVLDIGVTDGGLPFIIWELLRGLTLGDHLREHGAMTDAQVVRVTSQLLKSLMEAHSLGVVHRDIKPANIFVTSHPGEELFVKLLDFGIAKDMATPGQSSTLAGVVQASRGISPSTSASSTGASQTLGTPRYMAPEQLTGDLVGPATDLYAVGLVMSEMLTGRPVYDAETALQLILDRSLGAPTPLPPEAQRSRLFPIMARATALAPESRFGSAKEMLTFLEQALSAAPPSAQPSAGPSQQISGAAASLPASQLQAQRHGAPPTYAMPSRPSAPAHSVAPSATYPSAYASQPSSITASPVYPAPPPALPPPPAARAKPKRGAWVALAIGLPAAAALAVGGALMFGAAGSSEAAKDDDDASTAKKPKKTATAITSGPTTSTATAVAAPPPKGPSVPLKDRAIAALSPDDVKKRLFLAGFTSQSEPTETKSELGRYVNMPVVRGECFGAVHYYDYVNAAQLAELEGSMRKMVSVHAIHRSGGRMIQATFTGRQGVSIEPCEIDALDALTK